MQSGYSLSLVAATTDNQYLLSDLLQMASPSPVDFVEVMLAKHPKVSARQLRPAQTQLLFPICD
jgi:hypothetical protein